MYKLLNGLTQSGCSIAEFKIALQENIPEMVISDELATQQVKARTFDVYGDTIRIVATFIGSQKYGKESLKTLDVTVMGEAVNFFKLLLKQNKQKDGTTFSRNGGKLTIDRMPK